MYALDDRTANSSDYVYKTMFWFGGDELHISPDSIMYGLIEPVGDLNNDQIQEYISLDEYGDNTGKIFGTLHISNGTSIRIKTHESYVENRAYLRNIDLDNDGYNDFISFNHTRSSKDTSDTPLIYFGGNNPDSLNLTQLDMQLPDSLKKVSGWQTLKALDLGNNGSLELISFFSTNEGPHIGVYQTNEERQFELTQLFQYYYPFKSDNTPSFFSTDFDDKGLKELNFSANGYLTTLYQSGDASKPIISDSSRILNPVYDLVPIGDFDGNGNPDYLLTQGTSIYSIAELNKDGSLTNYLEITFDNFLESENRISTGLYREARPIDLNSDGYNDIIFSSITWAGNKYSVVIFGNSERNTESFQTIESIPVKNTYSSVSHTFSLGDVNNDSFEDFGFIRNTHYNNTYLEIYLAGNNQFDTPDYTIFLDDTVITSSRPTMGDFDGDGVNEIFLFYEYANKNLLRYGMLGIELSADLDSSSITYFDPVNYFGTENFTPRKKSYAQNIGDLNDDGSDELALFNEGISDSTFIFIEPDSILSNTHLSIPFKSSHIIGLGDIDANGTPNFAVSNPKAFLNTPEHEFNAIGVVQIFELDPETNRILDPVFTLSHPTRSVDNIKTEDFGASITSGDFNGDSITDIAVLANTHFNHSTNDGSDAVFYYYGGENFSNVTSLSFPILNSIVANEPNFPGFAYTTNFHLSAIPDLNTDNSDALLLLPEFNGNAIVADGNLEQGITMENAVILPNSNPIAPFGTPYPAIGNFNSTPGIDIILTQTQNPNFLSSPVYLFEIQPSLVSIETGYTEIPFTTTLHQNYPNPFNPSTSIDFELAQNGKVTLEIFNVLGRKIATMVDENLAAGMYSLPFNAHNLASGFYIYRLKTNTGVLSKKMVLLK